MANSQNPEEKPVDQSSDQPEQDTPPPPEDGHGCDPLPDPPPAPELPPIKKCDPRCDCPGKPGGSESCLDTLIHAQDKLLKEAERAKTFKAALEELLGKAKAARQAYTRDKYEDFKKRWDRQDQEIVGAIDTVICNVKCWWCVIECEICPLLYKIRELELQLDGPPDALIGSVGSERDLEYWHQRNVFFRTQVFERIKAVLNAWNDPAASIEKVLTDNDKLIKSIRSKEPSETILDVFFKLIPLHLAIAPRPVSSRIDRKYIDLCGECDEGVPDDCCGPDVGVLSARQRLTDLQAYIVDPDQYFGILCCIAENRYLPAKDLLAKAESDLAAVQGRIASLTADLERRKKSLFEDYRANIVTPIDCDRYRKKNGDDCGCPDNGKQAADPAVR
jgi:hypothetical protein